MEHCTIEMSHQGNCSLFCDQQTTKSSSIIRKLAGSGNCHTQAPAAAAVATATSRTVLCGLWSVPAGRRPQVLLLSAYNPESGHWSLCHCYRKPDPSIALLGSRDSGDCKTTATASVLPARPYISALGRPGLNHYLQGSCKWSFWLWNLCITERHARRRRE